jgi:haloalkane dehalogenase
MRVRADVHDRTAAYSAWLKTASLPKLFLTRSPVYSSRAELGLWRAASLTNTASVVRGLHFLQEDSPEEIGRAIAGWLE